MMLCIYGIYSCYEVLDIYVAMCYDVYGIYSCYEVL